ncbi:MAG: TOBE-like domain-containing protein [Thermomicrobiales bacterium]
MRFVGKINRVGNAYIRPHEVVICHPDHDGCIAAVIERVISLGFDNRLELRLPDGERVWAQLTRDEVARLRPAVGQTVGVDLSRGRSLTPTPLAHRDGRGGAR